MVGDSHHTQEGVLTFSHFFGPSPDNNLGKADGLQQPEFAWIGPLETEGLVGG